MKKRSKILLIICTVIIIIFGLFLIYASDFYKADELANSILANENNISFDENLIILTPETSSEKALIFYPGAKVEAISYLPILEKLQKRGITCILVKMPFKMAIFNQKAADKVFSKFPKIEEWYIGGHSMGGAMASSYAAKNKNKVQGLILLGAYIYGDYDPKNALTIYGTFNSNLEKNINYNENIIIIEGGNHAQFGNYGKQKGDPDATITSEEQQSIAVEEILNFINK